MTDQETIEICPIWRAIIQNVGYKPHPWDNAREGTLTGVDDAVRAIREHIAADLIASLRSERDALREALVTIAGPPERNPELPPIYQPRWSACQCRDIARAALAAGEGGR